MSDQENIQYYIVLTSFVMPLLMSILLIWFFVKFQKRKNQHEIDIRDAEIQKQKSELERNFALESERTRIAAEMHDDLGGGLTSIKFLSQKMLRKIDDPNQRTQIKKITTHAQNLVSNMSEIIWAMNAGFDTLDSLIAYTRRYVHEYLEENELELKFVVNGDTEGILMSGEKRRHIYLIVKECLHNIVKHANARKVSISFLITDNLSITIKDDGIGLDASLKVLGNGLQNIKTRVEKLDGEIVYENKQGLVVKISLPLLKKQ